MTTIDIQMKGKEPVRATDLVHSPDDGGYYLSQMDLLKSKSRISKAIFETAADAKSAYWNKTVTWEAWS